MMSANPIPLLSERDRCRFTDKFVFGDADDCWLWTGAKNASGYGVFRIGEKQYRAHRVAVRAAGYSVPTNGVIDHICRNRACVNPAHLRTVDRLTNVHENSEALAHLNAQKTHCPKGHAYSGDNLVVRASGRRRCRQCTIEYQRDLRRQNLRPSGECRLSQGDIQ